MVMCHPHDAAAMVPSGHPELVEPTDEPPPKHVLITIATYNICSGRAGCMEMGRPDEAGLWYPHGNQVDRWRLYQELFGVPGDCHQCSQCSPGRHCIVYHESEYWQVKLVVKHGPNVISIELVSGQQCTPIIGGYIPPNDMTTLPHINAALSHFSEHCDAKCLVLLGELNVDLSSQDRDKRGTEIANVLSAHGFEDFLLHFKPSHQIPIGRLGGRSIKAKPFGLAATTSWV